LQGKFIINNYIGIHPLALMNHRSLDDAALKKLNTKLRAIQMRKPLIEKLRCGKKLPSFYPNKTIVRFSDFKAMNIITF
jgi:pyruvate,water dikinase